MTYAIRRGEKEEHAETRGRWRGDKSKKPCKAYISLTLPYPDAKIAGTLCGAGGPCKYVIMDSRLTNPEFMKQVIPGLVEYFNGNALADIFVACIMYMVVTPTCTLKLPKDISDHVSKLIRSTLDIPPEDPLPPKLVTKVPFIVRGVDDHVRFIERTNTRDGSGGVTTGGSGSGVTTGGSGSGGDGCGDNQDTDNAVTELAFEVRDLKRRFEELTRDNAQQASAQYETLDRKVTKVARAVNRLGQMRRIGVTAGGDNSSPVDSQRASSSGDLPQPSLRANSVLSRNPPCLYSLWDEYESGLGGNRPAKQFNRRERGAHRSVYSFRNRLWKMVEEMIRRGHSSRTAIEKIYQVVGPSLSVTAAIRALTPAVRDQIASM
jgi:hypothetical protein